MAYRARPATCRRNRWSAPTHRGGCGRRDFLSALGVLGAGAVVGCEQSAEGTLGRLDKVWGEHGVVDGRMFKPRAMSLDSDDNLYIVDFTARVLVYDADGEFLRSWSTPVSENGRPTGITVDTQRGEVMVADTHYFRVLFYTLEGELLEDRTIGGVNGRGPGEFAFVTDVVRDSEGSLYISEYGDNDRVQKFTPDGDYLLDWGAHGNEPGQFKRPQAMLFDPSDRLWVCDSCNHRVQVFDTQGELLFQWGEEGSDHGQLYYPYGMAMDAQGDLYLSEYGNHRVQKFSQTGESLGIWGAQGSNPGQLWDPWTLVIDSRGRLHVLDTKNHRVQRVRV